MLPYDCFVEKDGLLISEQSYAEIIRRDLKETLSEGHARRRNDLAIESDSLQNRHIENPSNPIKRIDNSHMRPNQTIRR